MKEQKFIKKRFHEFLGLKVIVLGASAGGVQALLSLLPSLPENFPLPLIIVQHILPTEEGGLAGIFQDKCSVIVKEAEDREQIRAGTVYLAPSNYHLLIERTGSFALSVDEKVSYSRPSIDVLFESGARAYHSQLLALLLTGANDDGALGIQIIKKYGGSTIAQDPATAAFAAMPQAAIDTGAVDKVLSLQEINFFLSRADYGGS